MLREIKSNFQIFLFIIFSLPVLASAPEELPGVFDQMNYADVVDVTLRIDLDALTSDKRNEEKHPALLSYTDENGVEQTWNTKVKLRGKFRRMHCTDTPPMKLFFYKEDLKKAGLAGFNDLKLVNYCDEDKNVAKELLFKEYLAYKMYNEITDESFRVQLLRITYRDTKSRRKIKQWAFVIEDTAQLRARLSADKAKKYDSAERRAKFEKDQIQTMSVFQYMIGNTDWSMDYEKNVKFIEKNNKVLAIPYDFDFSGLVNPPYGIPNPNYNLTNMTDRVYLGIADEVYNTVTAINLFQEHKPEFVRLIKSSRHLGRNTKNEMLAYLDSFYENLSPEKFVQTMWKPDYVESAWSEESNETVIETDLDAEQAEKAEADRR